MPRDPAGNFTLEAGNPVQPSTTIATTWANPTLDDIAANLTDSLSRSGLGGMLVAFRNVDGIQAAPGITWTNELGSGFFRSGTGDFRAVVLGQNAARFRSDPANPFQVWDGSAFANVIHVGYQLQLTMGDGTENAPTYTYANSLGTGWWSSGVDIQNLSIAGIERVEIDAAAFTLELALELVQTPPDAATLRDGALAYDSGTGNLVMQRGGAYVVIPSSVPSDNILTEDTVVKAGNFPAVAGVFNYIDTTLGELTVTLPAGVEGSRWGYVDYFRQFGTNNVLVVPLGADLIEGLNETYIMDINAISGVLRWSTARGWVDTGGMA